jgi:ribonucleoside-diphosphate reductase alpha chain
MKFKRFFTDPSSGPYKDIVWEKRKSEIRNPDGKAIFSEECVVVPSFWSQVASDIIAQKYFRKAGVPADKIYEWQKWLPDVTLRTEGRYPLPEDDAEPGPDNRMQLVSGF